MKDILSRNLHYLVLLVAIGSLFFPEFFSHIKTSWVSYLLGAVMFGMGMTIKLQDFKLVFSRPKDIIIGSIAQFTIMPLLAWSLCKLFNLPNDLAIGVMLVGCCPGGTSSNVITYLSGGDLALSVGMTGVSTILAPIVTPLLTWLLAGTYADFDVVGMLISILQVVIIPIILGLLCQKYFKSFTKAVVAWLPSLSALAISLIVAAVVSSNANKLMACGLLIVCIVVLHNLLGFLLGLIVGKALRLNRKKCTAISIEVGMQNSGLACSLAQQHFSSLALASVPGAIFSVWHNIAGAIMAKIFQRYCKN